MTDRIVQLQDRSSNNVFPIAGGTTQGVITKAMFSDDAAFVDSTIGTISSTAYVSNANIQDYAITTPKINGEAVTTAKLATGAVTSDKIDWTTLERTVFQRNLIGTYIDNNNKKHDLYRIYYAFTDTIAAGGYVAHNVALSDCYILSADFNLYRTDAAGVINIANDSGIFAVVFTDNGNYLRVMNNLNQAQTSALVTGVVECYKKAEQS